MREPMIPVNKLSTSGIDEHWHKCADEARSVADDMKDEISKQMMLQIADDYERLAKRAAHREPGDRLIGWGPRGAGGGEEQAGEARCPSPPQTLFAGEVGREGHSIAGLAAAGSSRHWQKIAAIPASAGILPRSWH